MLFRGHVFKVPTSFFFNYYIFGRFSDQHHKDVFEKIMSKTFQKITSNVINDVKSFLLEKVV
jgi:hypothetical protein